jgi:hypothetical protein
VKLSAYQHQEVERLFELLEDRTQAVRSAGGRVPESPDYDLVLIEGELYDLDSDDEARDCLNVLRGIAVGLSFDSVHALYLAYKAGFEEPDDPLDIATLIVAARRAIMSLKNERTLPAREASATLATALYPWRGRN